MNIIILILAGITAYILACLFRIVDCYVTKWELQKEEKKRYSNELYAFKVRKILHSAYHLGLEQGYSPKQARAMAYKYTHDVENSFMVDNKFKLAKEIENEYRRNQSCC